MSDLLHVVGKSGSTHVAANGIIPFLIMAESYSIVCVCIAYTYIHIHMCIYAKAEALILLPPDSMTRLTGKDPDAGKD